MHQQGITYRVNAPVTPGQFVDLLQRSGLDERRPVDDPDCVELMVRHANLLVTAWLDGRLVGVARSVTDFGYCCYLSDLAVDRKVQKRGIGKELIRRTGSELGPKCKIILLAAPAARDYYSHIGFTQHPGAWIVLPSENLE